MRKITPRQFDCIFDSAISLMVYTHADIGQARVKLDIISYKEMNETVVRVIGSVEDTRTGDIQYYLCETPPDSYILITSVIFDQKLVVDKKFAHP